MRALVVGGGTGLGLASAKALVAAGGRVFLTGRRKEVLAAVETDLGAGAAGHAAGDATDEADVQRIVSDAVAHLGSINCLVVSAGATAIGSVADAELEDVRRVLDANLLPTYLFTKHVLPHMPDAGGSVIVIASIAGSVPHPERLAYCTAKAGVIGMVKQMALDLAARRIRVNAVSPSLVLTDLTREAIGRAADPAATLERRRSRHPLGRLGTAEEVGAAVAYLASDLAGWTTGHDIRIDGGLSLASMY
ncbi:SDR family NAD(P)-dependent oxidoreductase [Chelatococcus sp. GCM10030263]|uniref:SDR family NAD(P)-dependent oxidoreductase n=1 Tax=Chelatococcus sp. GCM10030263 TaxID=3273387 RepID=UPI003607EC67